MTAQGFSPGSTRQKSLALKGPQKRGANTCDLFILISAWWRAGEFAGLSDRSSFQSKPRAEALG